MFSPSPAESSAHSHRSSDTSRSISLSPSPRSYQQPLVKKPRKRKGKIVNVLRQRYAFDSNEDQIQEKQLVAFQSSNFLSPTSTVSIVQRAQLAAGLEHHLITLAWSTISQMNFPLWEDLKCALERLQANLHAQRTSPATNAQVQCLIALGARKSNHSMLFSSDLQQEYTRTGDVVRLGLGKRRERVCMQLVEQAIEASQDAGYFSHQSQDSIDSLALLRMLLNASAPRHPALVPLVEATGRNYRAGVSTMSEASSLIASDAGCSLFFGTPLTVSDEEMRLFGWADLDMEQMKATLSASPVGSRLDVAATLRLREFVIASMRRLAQYQSRGWVNDRDSSAFPAEPVFKDVFEIGDAMERAVISLQLYPHSLCPPVTRTLHRSNHLVKLPIFFNSAIIKIARRLVETGMDPDAHVYLTQAQVRYCSWFRTFAMSLNWAGDDSIEVVSSSVLVEGLEFLEGWMELVVEAARQAAAGEGPLSSAGLTWDHLRQFRELLKISGTVFATSDEHELQLGRQLEMLDLSGAAGAKSPRENAVAEQMLQSALMEMIMD